MDNKRLKTFVAGWFLGYPIDCEKSEEDEALRIILTMIDSQPGEEKEKYEILLPPLHFVPGRPLVILPTGEVKRENGKD